MSRSVSLIIDQNLVQREIPLATDEVLLGVPWGDPWTLFTPAYWLTQAWMLKLDSKNESRYRARDGIVGEVVFCLLGGYGISAELATAAYEKCRELALFQSYEKRPEAWAEALSGYFQVNGRSVRYRFPNQKSRFLASAMAFVESNEVCQESGLKLRNQLLHIDGIGYKTASWIARNVLNADDVAILDIHLVRAGQICGIFSLSQRVERNYLEMEKLFLNFCSALNIKPSTLDCLIWDEMRAAGSLPLQILRSQDPRVSTLAKRKKPKGGQLQFTI